LVTKTKDLAKSVTNVVFTPTALAYCWSFLGYVIAALSLYLVFMAVAFKMGLFDDVIKWPRISQAALFSGPVLVGLGCYLSTKQTSYPMLIPTGMYAVLSILGGVALRKLNAS